MTRLLFLTALITLTLNCKSQELLVYNTPTLLYKGIQTSLLFTVKGVPCSRITFKIKNGTIRQDGCRIYIEPDSTGLVKITAHHRNGKEMGIYSSYAIQKPLLKAFIGGKSGGKISKEYLLAVGALLTRIDSDQTIEIPIQVNSYKILILRNNEKEALIVNNGARFGTETKGLINSLKSGDSIIFFEITSTVNERTENSYPIELIVE